MRLKEAKKGSQHHNATLTEEDIPKIRKMVRDGVPVKEIAAKYKITTQTVGSIKNFRSWRHVPDESEERGL